MLRRSLLFLLMSVVVLSCDDTTGPDDDLLGTWSLRSVSGQSLPYVLEQDATVKIELTGETVTLLASGRQTMVTLFRVTDGGVVSTESVPASGNYTVTGSTLLLTFDNDTDTYTAIVKDGNMTIDDIGLTFVYRRD
jgi:hypothetical protein